MIQEACIQGISTRSVDGLVPAMGMEGRSKSQVSRPIESDWPYLWLGASQVRARRDSHIVSVAVPTIAAKCPA